MRVLRLRAFGVVVLVGGLFAAVPATQGAAPTLDGRDLAHSIHYRESVGFQADETFVR